MRSAAVLGAAAAAAAAPATNVLMIAIDDQRPELGCYGAAHMHTPNYDRLAARSTLFERAYVQVALCSPSRTSLLTSRRPDTSRVWDISKEQYWRECGGNFTTLPQVFKEAGFNTYGMGKVFHEGAPSRDQDVRYSWSEGANVGKKGDTPGGGLFEGYTRATGPHNGTAQTEPCFWKYSTERDEDVADGMLAQHAAEVITNLSKKEKPFFVAVGFHKPHVPWYAPERYWDLYPSDAVDLAPHRVPPVGVPPVAMQTVIESWSEGEYTDLTEMAKGEPFSRGFPLDNTTVPNWKALQMRRAYWAATSFTDRNIGVVLDALDASAAANNTAIALWGDHGYQLGDNDMWAKQTCFEHATRVPFMVHLPGAAPRRTAALVEAIDLFPTLVAAAGLADIPACPQPANRSREEWLCTEGRSLLPLVTGAATEWPHAAFSQYERAGDAVMGYTVRTDTYRYTEWVAFDAKAAEPDWSKSFGRELYDHTASPVPAGTPEGWGMETVNEAELPDRAALVAALSKQLRAGWSA
eukprot:TRINITY_DN14215_c0_g1_i1.p1 TRINITY_DN14215_c0_g1~~TRINITY_DN14215_c0_g1_i1.p1  ORF type:complete len:539 (+),score=166.32 TRINITY_DN14215_c0_g1_i1:50-1618(+)